MLCASVKLLLHSDTLLWLPILDPKQVRNLSLGAIWNFINPLEPELFVFNFSTPCIQNVNNIGTKQVSIMKQTAF